MKSRDVLLCPAPNMSHLLGLCFQLQALPVRQLVAGVVTSVCGTAVLVFKSPLSAFVRVVMLVIWIYQREARKCFL